MRLQAWVWLRLELRLVIGPVDFGFGGGVEPIGGTGFTLGNGRIKIVVPARTAVFEFRQGRLAIVLGVKCPLQRLIEKLAGLFQKPDNLSSNIVLPVRDLPSMIFGVFSWRLLARA